MLTIHTNLTNGASSQLTGFDFNSYCRFGDHLLAMSSTKLCSIGGETNGGVNIAASFSTFAMKLGHDGDKRLMFIYVGLETEGTVIVTPYYDGVAGPAVTFTPAGPGRQYMRRPVGRGSRGCYLTFKVENVDGCWFAIDEVQVLPGYLPLRQG